LSLRQCAIALGITFGYNKCKAVQACQIIAIIALNPVPWPRLPVGLGQDPVGWSAHQRATAESRGAIFLTDESSIAEPDATGNSRRAGKLTVYGNLNIIVAGHVPLRRQS